MLTTTTTTTVIKALREQQAAETDRRARLLQETLRTELNLHRINGGDIPRYGSCDRGEERACQRILHTIEEALGLEPGFIAARTFADFTGGNITIAVSERYRIMQTRYGRTWEGFRHIDADEAACLADEEELAAW